MDRVSLMLKHIDKWEKEIESDLLTSQTISDKTRKQKILLAKQKREQDMLIYRHTSDIWRIQAESDTLDIKIKIKENEREKLCEAVIFGNADIEAMQLEHKCLLHSWGSIISAIGLRSKALKELNQDLQ